MEFCTNEAVVLAEENTYEKYTAAAGGARQRVCDAAYNHVYPPYAICASDVSVCCVGLACADTNE